MDVASFVGILVSHHVFLSDNIPLETVHDKLCRNFNFYKFWPTYILQTLKSSNLIYKINVICEKIKYVVVVVVAVGGQGGAAPLMGFQIVERDSTQSGG